MLGSPQIVRISGAIALPRVCRLLFTQMEMADASEASTSRLCAKLRVAGAWSGVVEVPLAAWTVADLRAELARRTGFSAASINLICAGKILKDEIGSPAGLRCLRQVGLSDNSKLMMTRVGVEQAKEINAEKERSERLSRIKAAVDAMSARSGDNDMADYDLALENQDGQQMQFKSDDDRKALIMGLMLHAKARNFVQEEQFSEALEVLTMAEEAFSICDRKILEAVDNVALVQIDIVWCLFRLRNIDRLSVARERLAQARAGLSRAHGPNLERLRVLQGGFSPELALYVRLELLEGVVAYHTGQNDSARRSLLAAQIKYQQLQVSDEAVASLVAMGFTIKECRRALRVSEQDIGKAVDFVMEGKRKKEEKREEDSRLLKERREQRKYGKTSAGKLVDMKKLGELVSLGYGRKLAAEALKQSDNNREMALDMLGNPTTALALQASLRHLKRRHPEPVDEAALVELMSMGFDHESATRALTVADDTAQALELLLQGRLVDAETTSPGGHLNSGRGAEDSFPGSSGPSDANVDAGYDASVEDGSQPDETATRDEEMEEDIASNITGDPLGEYDIEVMKEGEAIAEYLTLLDSIVSA